MEYVEIKFSEIESNVPEKPGLYEIYTNDDVPLKVGISKNLKKRLLQHYASRQNALKLRTGGSWSSPSPSDVTSKGSILAKHLYFSDTFTQLDLKTEDGRKKFLEENCFIKFIVTATREEARDLEKVKEAEGTFKFVGKPILNSTTS